MLVVDFTAGHAFAVALIVFALPLVAGLIPLCIAQYVVVRIQEGPRKVREARALERRCALDAFEAGLANMNTRLDQLELALAPKKGGLQ